MSLERELLRPKRCAGAYAHAHERDHERERERERERGERERKYGTVASRKRWRDVRGVFENKKRYKKKNVCAESFCVNQRGLRPSSLKIRAWE